MTHLHRQRGLTLIELMLSMTLGLLLLIGIGSLFLQSNRSNRQNELVSGLQDQGRYALATLSRDLMMAGYWGGMYSGDRIAPNLRDTDLTNDSTSANSALPLAADCGPSTTVGWAFDMTRRVEFRNQDSATSVAATWRCLAGVQPLTDIVSIRHVAGQPTLLAALQTGRTYLQTNGTEGTVMRWGGAIDPLNKPLSGPMSFYRYVPRIYFVRAHSRSAGDGLPALCRAELGSGGIATECIAEGVEDLQLVWGLDTDSDGSPNLYTSRLTGEQTPNQIVTAQIFLLLRAQRADATYTDGKRYQLGDREVTPTSAGTQHFYRRVFSTTVQLRNPVN